MELGVIMFLYHCYFHSFHLGRIRWRARVHNKLPMTFFCHTVIYIYYNVVLFFGGSILKSYKIEVFCYRVLSLVLPKTCYWQSDLTISWSEVQSCPTLCDPMDCSLPGFSIHGIFQARILEWVAISFSRGSSQPRDRILVSCIAGRVLTLWATISWQV